MTYDLSHLTQPPEQRVWGPVQDDEALLLFALCRVMRIRRVIEIGVQHGYSTRNFLAAVGPQGEVVGIDKDHHGVCLPRFTLIQADVGSVLPEQIPWTADLVFFDSHAEDAQKKFYLSMSVAGKISDATVLAIHDTGLHPAGMGQGMAISGGVMHQPAERSFCNWLLDHGWSAFHAHAPLHRLGVDLPYRHGLTLMAKNQKLETA
jgi:predicted O-methyltransferase YrrM